MCKLWIAMALCAFFMIVEVIVGYIANSLSIVTDAAHLLTDVAALAISLFSLWAAGWEANPRQTYGYFRIEPLGALVSILFTWVLAGILVYVATVRMIHNTNTDEVNGFLMWLVDVFGLGLNIIMAIWLGHRTEDSKHEHHHSDIEHAEPLPAQEKGKPAKKQRNMNVQGAYLYVLGDCIQSVGVIIGGGIIWCKPEWEIVDLICTLIFSVIVVGTTVDMMRNIYEVLMESTPREIDAAKLERDVLAMEEVVVIHELHIWAITVGKILLTCHVKIRPETDADSVINYIRTEYNINHVTIQIEHAVQCCTGNIEKSDPAS